MSVEFIAPVDAQLSDHVALKPGGLLSCDFCGAMLKVDLRTSWPSFFNCITSFEDKHKSCLTSGGVL